MNVQIRENVTDKQDNVNVMKVLKVHHVKENLVQKIYKMVKSVLVWWFWFLFDDFYLMIYERWDILWNYGWLRWFFCFWRNLKKRKREREEFKIGIGWLLVDLIYHHNLSINKFLVFCFDKDMVNVYQWRMQLK